MRLIGLLSWFDERPTWLTECISTYHQAGITHLVAIDGRYQLYPAAHNRSSFANHDAIISTCRGLNLPLTLHIPSEPWAGNEIEKRTHLFRLADTISTDGEDWYLIIDADERVTHATKNWTSLLETTDLDTAAVLLTETEPRDTPAAACVDRQTDHNPVTTGPIRKLFRSHHGTQVVRNHYTYVDRFGDTLWSGRYGAMVPELDLTQHVTVNHLTKWRSQHRYHASHNYYRERNQVGAEKA